MDINKDNVIISPDNLVIKENGNYTVIVNTLTDGDKWEISQSNNFEIFDGIIEYQIISNTKNSCVFNIVISEADFGMALKEHIELVIKQSNSNGDEYTYSYYFDIIGDVTSFPVSTFALINNNTVTSDDGYLVTRQGEITWEYDELTSVNVTIQSSRNVNQWTIPTNRYFNIEMVASSTTQLEITITPRGVSVNTQWLYQNIIINAKYTSYLSGSITVTAIMKNLTVIPVWKDTTISIQSSYTGNVYEIIDNEDDSVIYAGVISMLPNSTNSVIYINNIVRNYLNSTIGTLSNGIKIIKKYVKTVTVKIGDKGIATYRIYNDWSYDNPTSQLSCSYPIRKLLDSRQYFLYSLFNSNKTEEDLQIYLNIYTTGNTLNYTVPISPIVQIVTCNKLKNIDNPTSVRILSDVYTVQKTCYDYCLYYVNAYGGWDSLLIQGNSKKNDKITSSYYNKSYNNTTTAFGKVKYNNLINTTYTLFTDWFTDEEQSKLHHLLESTEVYLHDLNNDVVIPVVITNTNCEWKTFSNNGKKKFYNEIIVESSQEKIRL
jgi:hypothetical protein